MAVLDYDAQLMLRVREGDDESFALLLAKYRLPVIKFLFRMVRDQAVAEELAQDAFLRVYRSRAAYKASAKFTTWLFRIASRLALNWIRDTKAEYGREEMREFADARASAEQWLVADSRMGEVRAAVALLPPRQRAAVLMHKFEDMDYSQIAEALELSESAVKSLLFRAYESLRSSLAHLAG